MKATDFNIIIAGQAGQGLNTISGLLLKTLTKGGWHVYASQNYMSRVRGGHNFMNIRISQSPVFSTPAGANMLVALDQRSVDEHLRRLEDPAVVVYDMESVKPAQGANGTIWAGAPLLKLAKENGGVIYQNSVALGGIMALLGVGLTDLSGVFSKRFSKNRKVLEDNVRAAKAGFDYMTSINGHFNFMPTLPQREKRLLMNGAEAMGLGMIAGGLRFVAAYPMSPSTGVFTYIAEKAARVGIIAEQAEDEIAAINMAIGASAAGARSATMTSGGGLALMVEGVSLAGIMETPLVIADLQRPGPATGLPTRTGQEDLDFVLSLGHGEFPRFIFAPGTVEETFYTSAAAMNLADKYQVPVFILGDQLLVDSYSTLDKLDIPKIRNENYLISNEHLGKEPYLRYRFTETGVSPRAYFGQAGTHFISDCHVHEEDGHISEDAEISSKMAEKRFRKLIGMKNEPYGPKYYGPEKAQVALVCWGSTYGAVKETVDNFGQEGGGLGMVHFNRIWPFPGEDTLEILRGCKKIFVVENNIQGQFNRLLRRETGIRTEEPILRYDGRPFSVQFITQEILTRLA
ncbi:MAG: 2-oxoacid:acceptor oxidoreductase subunit alpha [Nitrospinae bacterium]|nr:2-oxoacid:acceptor oxidoreductase subunit alpha [Nitrospinota bacterium]